MSARESAFARRLSQLSSDVERSPTVLVEDRPTVIVEEHRRGRLVPMCSNTMLIIAIAIPLIVWAWLWFATPNFWKINVNGVLVRDVNKIAITVIAVAAAALALVFLSNGSLGSCPT